MPPTGSSIQTNLNVPIPDTARGTRPNNGPFAAVMFCLPTPGSPPGSDCFQRTSNYFSNELIISERKVLVCGCICIAGCSDTADAYCLCDFGYVVLEAQTRNCYRKEGYFSWFLISWT